MSRTRLASPIKTFCGHLHVLNILRALHIITMEAPLPVPTPLSLPTLLPLPLPLLGAIHHFWQGAKSISKIVSTLSRVIYV